MWPIDAGIGENGAFYFTFAGGRLQKQYRDPPETRARNHARLAAIASNIVAAVTGRAHAGGQPYRGAGLARRYLQDVLPLPLHAVQRPARLLGAARPHG